MKAKVQGSSSKPYSVTIKVRTLTGSEWDLLAEKLARKPIFAAKLLAGEMPEDIETAFEDSGLSLFPEKLDDLETDCSCPDWSNPCKHIAAVYYLLGEEFDRDPFLIFKLRGVDMDDFMSILGKAPEPEIVGEASESGILIEGPEDETGYGAGTVGGAGSEAATIALSSGRNGAGTGNKTGIAGEKAPISPELLPLEPETFWGRSPEKPEEGKGITLEARIPEVPAALPKRLGKFPFWRGEEDLLEVLEEIYSKASPAGMKVFLGENK